MAEPTARELVRLHRQMRVDFYARCGEEPPTYRTASVVMVDTSPAAPVRKPPPPRAPAPPSTDTRRGRMLAWLVVNGPSTTPQIAHAIGEETGRTNVWLMKLAQRGYTERTGRKIPSPNSRPHTEWRATAKADPAAFRRERK